MKFLILALLVIHLGLTAHAHHGISAFDHDQEVEVTGVITRLRFVNPHSWLYLDVRTADGKVEAWQCELRSANVMKRVGWRKDMFVIGELVTIKGSPARKKGQTCYVGNITFANGISYDRYAQINRDEQVAIKEQPERLANGDPNINGDWMGVQMVLTDPTGVSGAFVPLQVAEAIQAGEIPADQFKNFPGTRGVADQTFDDQPIMGMLTEVGRLAVKEFDPIRDNPRFQCQPTSIIFDYDFDTDVNRIIQSEKTITLFYGHLDLRRTIHLNMNNHPKNVKPSRAGHSIGHWEDDVLIVDTQGFAPGIIHAFLSKGSAIPHGDHLQVTEKFYLSDDRSTLIRDYSAVDKVHLNKPYTGSNSMVRSGKPYLEPSCEEIYFKDVEEVF